MPLSPGLVLPNPLVLDFNAVGMTSDEFLQFCSDNDDLRFELTADCEVVVMPPTDPNSSIQRGKIAGQLWDWAEKDASGLLFGPNAGFTFPNGAVRAANGSWLRRDRWDQLPKEEKGRFARVVPDFVYELLTPADRLCEIQIKMDEYMENGARLGWLIDPFQRRVHIYRPGQLVEVLEDPATVSGEAVLPGFELNPQEVWEPL